MTALLLCDLDGTLLDGAGHLYSGSVDLMEACADTGVMVGLCSARPPRSVKSICKQLPSIRFASSLQGAFVEARSRAKGIQRWTTISQVSLDSEDVSMLTAALAPRPVWWYSPTEWRVDADTAAAREEATIIGYDWDGCLSAEATQHVCKILAIEADRPQRLVEQVRAVGLPVLCHESKPGYVEIVSDMVGADKGARAIKLATTDRIAHPPTVYALGDGLNDLGMLREAHIGITFQDAHESLQSAATWVLESERSCALRELAASMRSLAHEDERLGGHP